jgi:hypothetical protein
MATYKGINGYAVQTVASDPSPGDPGQVFYNTTAKTFEYTVIQQGAWASGGNMPAAKQDGGSAGTQTAALGFGGYDAGSSPPANSVRTLEYDGSTWTVGGNLPLGRAAICGVGTQTSALAAGGYTVPGFSSTNSSQEYDGSAWTSGGTLSTPRGTGMQGAGTQTAALMMGGVIVSNPPLSIVGTLVSEEYDGTSWTSGGNMNQTRDAGTGTSQTAALAFGGDSNGSLTEEYDGTSWTAGGNLNTGRGRSASAGSQTAGLDMGGGPSASFQISTELYDGTSWSVGATIPVGTYQGFGCGTQTSAIMFGGEGSLGAGSQEFTGGPVNVNKTISFS